MLEQSNPYNDGLTGFFHIVKNDGRLTATHLSIYFVLYRYWVANKAISPFHITRKKVMKRAKVSIATYHKHIKQLHDYGYITYLPSYNPAIGSMVYLHLDSTQKPNRQGF